MSRVSESGSLTLYIAGPGSGYMVAEFLTAAHLFNIENV